MDIASYLFDERGVAGGEANRKSLGVGVTGRDVNVPAPCTGVLGRNAEIGELGAGLV